MGQVQIVSDGTAVEFIKPTAYNIAVTTQIPGTQVGSITTRTSSARVVLESVTSWEIADVDWLRNFIGNTVGGVFYNFQQVFTVGGYFVDSSLERVARANRLIFKPSGIIRFVSLGGNGFPELTFPEFYILGAGKNKTFGDVSRFKVHIIGFEGNSV